MEEALKLSMIDRGNVDKSFFKAIQEQASEVKAKAGGATLEEQQV